MKCGLRLYFCEFSCLSIRYQRLARLSLLNDNNIQDPYFAFINIKKYSTESIMSRKMIPMDMLRTRGVMENNIDLVEVQEAQ